MANELVVKNGVLTNSIGGESGSSSLVYDEASYIGGVFSNSGYISDGMIGAKADGFPEMSLFSTLGGPSINPVAGMALWSEDRNSFNSFLQHLYFPELQIDEFSNSNSTITLASHMGDQTKYFPTGAKFDVSGASEVGNNIEYTVVSSSYDNTNTIIVVDTAPTDETSSSAVTVVKSEVTFFVGNPFVPGTGITVDVIGSSGSSVLSIRNNGAKIFDSNGDVAVDTTDVGLTIGEQISFVDSYTQIYVDGNDLNFKDRTNPVAVTLTDLLAGNSSLDDAYNNGSSVEVDDTNVEWTLSASKFFKIIDSSSVNIFSATPNSIQVGAVAQPTDITIYGDLVLGGSNTCTLDGTISDKLLISSNAIVLGSSAYSVSVIATGNDELSSDATSFVLSYGSNQLEIDASINAQIGFSASSIVLDKDGLATTLSSTKANTCTFSVGDIELTYGSNTVIISANSSDSETFGLPDKQGAGGTFAMISDLPAVILNENVDTGNVVIDSFSDTSGNAAMWYFVAYDDSLANVRAGHIISCWKAADDTVEYNVVSTSDIGSVDIVFSVDISSNDVRLVATTGSNNWNVKVSRTLL